MAHTPWSKRLFALALSYVLYSSSWFVSSNKDGRLAVNGLERSIIFPRIVEYALSTFLAKQVQIAAFAIKAYSPVVSATL